MPTLAHAIQRKQTLLMQQVSENIFYPLRVSLPLNLTYSAILCCNAQAIRVTCKYIALREMSFNCNVVCLKNAL